MAGHAIPLWSMSEKEHQARVNHEVEREVEKFTKAAANAVLRQLRGRETPYEKDGTLLRLIEGLLRQQGVRKADIEAVAQAVYEVY